jgi:hypothetical protein
MKKLLIIMTVLAVALSSCVSSQKKLQRRIEKHGIKESISFVVLKYPEYFRDTASIIHDTIVEHDTVPVPDLDTAIILGSALDYMIYKSDSLTAELNKATGELKIKYIRKPVYIHDTLYTKTECPEVKCPDCPDLQDNIKKENPFPWWMLILAITGIGVFYVWINRTKRKKAVSSDQL